MPTARVETGGLEMFYHPASDATALYIGDPVVKNGSADAAGISGAFARRRPARLPASSRALSLTALSTGRLWRGFDGLLCAGQHRPDQRYIIQETPAWPRQTLASTPTSRPVPAVPTRKSVRASTLDAATKATTATLQLKIRGLVPVPEQRLRRLQQAARHHQQPTEASASAGL
jgi:hypothetical protein